MIKRCEECGGSGFSGIDENGDEIVCGKCGGTGEGQKMTYRVFIGGFWDDDENDGGEKDYTHIDKVHAAWESARDQVRNYFKMYEDDDCEPDKEQAAKELARLEALNPGEEFTGDVEGNDVVIRSIKS